MNDISLIKEWLGSGTVNVFGLPFSGKDTQCEILAESLGATVASSGAIFREQQDNVELQQIMATGALIPSDMFFDIMLPFFNKPELAGKPLVLSSVGRMKGEEGPIVRATNESNHPIKAVIVLTIPEDVVWERHRAALNLNDRGSRPDDASDEILRNRIAKFNSQTLPVIEFYREKGVLVEVDGTKDRETVTQEIIASLKRLATA
jgi:adenylate kinase